MKNRLLFLMAMFMAQALYAQNDNLVGYLHHLVDSLDKSEVNSNFLWDKGTNGFAEPAIYDGALRDSVYLQPSAFGFLYVQAYHSFVGAGTNLLPHPDVYMDRLHQYAGTDTIALAALSLRYHRLAGYAIDSNLVTFQHDQLLDVPGRTLSPYRSDTLCAFVPLRTDAWHKTVHFTFPTELLWSNLNLTAPVYSVDPGDGLGYRTITPGQTLTVVYPDAGAKMLRTRIVNGALTLETQTVVFVAESGAEERGGGPNYPVETPELIVPIPGGGGDLRIFYGSPCNRLVRPFILVEGFEISENPVQFTERLKDLLRKKGVISLYPTLPLGEWLYAQGYDLVWVNLYNQQGRVQDNAAILQAAVQRINEIKNANGSNEPNLIMGASAGGIVANYMLLKSKTNGFDHQCEKFFSYDSPMYGANLPLSLQVFVEHAKEIATANNIDLFGSNPELDAAFGALSTDFARQILLYRYERALGVTSAEHDAFMNEVLAMGSLPIKHIAISNGSPDFQPRANISPGSMIFSANSQGQEWRFWPVIGLFLVKIDINADGWAMGNNSGDKVYSGGVRVTFTPTNSVIKRFELTVEVPANSRAYDTAPGGSSNIGIAALQELSLNPIVLGEIPAEIFGNISTSPLAVSVYATHHCFVPTRSAIFGNSAVPIDGPFSCSQGSSNRCTMNSEATPLPAFYGVSSPEVNQDHIFLDRRIGDLIVEESTFASRIPGSSSLPQSLTAYYNAGLPIQSGISSTNISTASGALYINNTGPVGFANGNEPVSPMAKLLAYTTCNAVIHVEQNAQLVIGANDRSKHGVLRVLKGSTVHVHSGGTLRITSGQSGLIIEKGAVLVIDPGAQVILEEAESFVRIEGKIIWNGDINYSGLGYFDFTSGYQIEFAPNLPQFRLIGQTPYNRFLRLQAPLNLPAGMDLNLQNGGVEYTAGGTIAASNGVEVNLQAMRLYGTATLAFDAYGCGKIDIQNSRFEGLEQVGNVYGGTTNNKCTITNSTFSGYFFGLYIVNRQEVTLTNCTFASTGGGITLLSHNNVVTRMKGCQIDGSGSGAGVGLNGGLLFWMDGGRISNCTDGIFCAAEQSGFEPANILLSNHATIENCENGVRADGNLTKGLLVATCSHFLHNKTGIRGTDLRLLLNWTQLTPSNLFARKPNRFLRASNHANADRYIDVCYRTFNPGTINAGHNLWLEDGFTGPVVVSNPLPHIRAAFSATNVDCVNGTALSVIAAPAAANQAQICLTEETPDPGPCIRCEEFTGGGGTVIDQFEAAFVQLPEDEAEEDVYTALERFSPVANLWQAALPESLSHTCKDYIRAARSLTEGLADIGPRQQAALSAPGTQLVLRPNPAAQGTWIDLPGTPVTIRVFDAFGQLKHQFATAASSHWLDTAAWPGGAYSVQVWDASGYTKSAVLIIQR